MNAKDENLVMNSSERELEARNDKMFASMANHLGEALRGVSNGNYNPTVERALLDIQSDIRVIREELCKLTGRVDIVERQLFQVIDRKPVTNEADYNVYRTESSGRAEVIL